MLDHNLEKFCNSWLEKAEGYSLGELSDCFDCFFTLYVVYNRLYVEAALRAAKAELITLNTSNGTFPDTNAATKFLLATLNSENIISKINLSKELMFSLITIVDLINSERFYINLTPKGESRRDKDILLSKGLRSVKPQKKLIAILEVVYLIRCNLFHGHKGYELTQRDLLIPVCNLLKFLTFELFHQLKEN